MKKKLIFLLGLFVSLSSFSIATTDYWADIEAMLAVDLNYPLLEKYCSYNTSAQKYQDCEDMRGRLEEKLVPKVQTLIKKIDCASSSFTMKKKIINNLLVKLDAIKVGKIETQKFLIELMHQEFAISLRNGINICSCVEVGGYEFGSKPKCCAGLHVVMDPDNYSDIGKPIYRSRKNYCANIGDGVCDTRYENIWNSKDCQKTCIELGEAGPNGSLGPNDKNAGRKCCNGLSLTAPINAYNSYGELGVGFGSICANIGDGICDVEYENTWNSKDC